MPRREGKAFNYWMDDHLRAALQALAEANGRPLHAELDHAVRRHLAAPPVLATPPLPDVPAPAPKRRGRPPKAK